MNKKYAVLETKGDQYEVRWFDSLAQAYRYWLEDSATRTIVKEVKVKVGEE